MLAGQSRLAYLIEADREVEQVIRIVTIRSNRVEIGLLCFRPAALAGVGAVLLIAAFVAGRLTARKGAAA